MSNVALQTVTEVPAPAPVSDAGAILQIIERAARDPAVDIGKMKELLAMRKEMMAFEAERTYDAAMRAAQSEMQPIRTDASNPQTKSRYATFDALDAALRPIYTKHGFSLSFGTADGAPPDHVRITCRIAHIGGHRQLEHLDMPTDGKGAKGNDVMTKTHATGAALTYGRRYLEGLIFNIAVTKDNDGNSASGGQAITPEQYQELQAMIERTGRSEDTLLQYLKLPPDHDVHTLTVEQYKKAKFGMTEFLRNMGRGK